MTSVSAKHKAAQAWCFDSTKHLQLDPVLANAFAEILDEIWSQPWLGNATTGEMIAELRARALFNEVEVEEGKNIISLMVIENNESECFLLDADYKTVNS